MSHHTVGEMSRNLNPDSMSNGDLERESWERLQRYSTLLSCDHSLGLTKGLAWWHSQYEPWSMWSSALSQDTSMLEAVLYSCQRNAAQGRTIEAGKFL